MACAKAHWDANTQAASPLSPAHSRPIFGCYMKAFTLTAFLILPAFALSQNEPDVLFMGHLEKLELIPRGRPGCPEPSAPEGQIVVSNFCGCGTAEFRVEIPVKPERVDRYTVNYRVGEWCEPDIHLFRGAKFLVFKAPERPYRWIETVETSHGDQGFYPAQLDLLLYDLGIEPHEISFGPETTGLCEEAKGELECRQEPVILVRELIQKLHITKGSTGRR